MQLSLSANPPVPIDRSGPGQVPLANKTSGRFSVVPWPAVASFFTSMSPNYTAKSLASSSSHSQPPSGPGKQPSLPGAIQGIGLASKAVSCWLPQVGLASEIIANACSSFSLAHQLGKASRQSDDSARPSGEKQTPPGQVLSNAFSGAGAAALGLIAMDSLAGAAAEELQTKPRPRPDGLSVDRSLTEIDIDGSSNQAASGEATHLHGADAVDEFSGDAVDQFSSGSGGSGGSGIPVIINEVHIHSIVSAGPTTQSPTEMASKFPQGELPDQAPPTTDALVITPSQAFEHTASHTMGVAVEPPAREAIHHPGNSSSAFMASATVAADTARSSGAATTSVLSDHRAAGDNFGRNLHHEIRFSSPDPSSDSAVAMTPSPTMTSSVASPASAAIAANTTQSSSAATTSVLSEHRAAGDNFGRNLHHEIRFSSSDPSSDSAVGVPPTATSSVANSTMAFADPVIPVDSTTATPSSYSPASSSPVETVFSTEAPPGPTPPPPLAELLAPGGLMAPNSTHMAAPPPVGLVALSHNSSHMALNGTSSAPMTPMSMVSPTSVLPVLPTSAVPAASAALSLAGGLSPLTLVGLSVGISAFMFGLGALHGRYADDKKEQ